MVQHKKSNTIGTLIKTVLIICLLFTCKQGYSYDSIHNTDNPQTKFDKDDYVLILNTYNSTNERSDEIQKNLTQTFYGKHHINVRLEELSALTMRTHADVETKKAYLLNRYAKAPRAVVIIDDGAWIIYREIFGEQWKRTPVIICPVWEYTTSLENYFDILSTGKILDSTSMIPYSESLKGYNATSVSQPLHYEQTIKLMQKMMPGMKKLAFISDNRYLSAQSRYMFRQIRPTVFPELEVINLQAGKITTDQLLDTLKYINDDTGILFHSWYTIESASGTDYLSNKTHRIIGSFTDLPIFTLADEGVRDGVFAGGYFSLIEEYCANISQVLNTVLRGIPAREIVPTHDNTPRTYLNYSNLQKYNVPRQLYPQDAIYYQKPENIYTVLLWGMLLGAIFLFLIFSVGVLMKKKSQKEKELSTLSKYKQLFNNMPVAYLKYQLTYKTSQTFNQNIIIDVNPSFCKEFGMDRSSLLGQPINTVTKDSFILDDTDLRKIIDKEKTVYMRYTHDDTGKYYDLVIFPTGQNDCVDVFFVNKTEQYKAARKANELMELNNKIIEAIPDMIFMFDKSCKIVNILNPDQDELPCAHEQLIGQKISAILDGEAASQYEHTIKEVFESHELKSFEYHIVKQSQTIYSNARMLFLDNNTVICFTRNVTLEHNQHTETQRIQFFLETVLDYLPIPVYVKDANNLMRYVYWNKEAELLFGAQRDQVIDKTDHDFTRKELADARRESDLKLLSEGNTYSGFEIFESLNGTMIPTMVTKSVIKFEELGTWILSARWDMSELQSTQQLLETSNHKLTLALEAADVIPWTIDVVAATYSIDAKYFHENNFSNHYQSNIVPLQMVRDMIHPQDAPNFSKAIELLCCGKITKIKEEIRINYLNNGYEWLEVRGIVDKRDKNGNVRTIVGASINTTKRKILEQDLMSAKEKAEESNRLKSAFLANMSHEIRTPLNAIVGFSGILASTDKEEEKREYVDIIESNNTLLLQLISDILDLSKIEAGTLDFIFTEVDINALFSEIARTSRMRLKSDKVTLNFEQKLAQCIIRTEKNRLQQVVTNFISNSIKFTTEGSIDIGYKLNNNDLYFYVRDTGCGIPTENLKHVFGRFVKLNSFVQGTGLGLSISETIIERLGGKIGVESEVGVGSTFWFTLPYNPLQAQQIQQVESHEKVEQQSELIPIEKDKLVILIAEDNMSNYKLFESILKKDYNLIHAWNGQEAVELFKEHNPHLILMDIKMPVLDGYGATSQIRALSPSVPIIAVTAFAFAEDEQRISKSGFDDFASKPIRSGALKEKIIELLKKRIMLI